MELLNHENTEIHFKHEITETLKLILKNKSLTCGNMEKLSVPTKEARKP